ncbi:dihydrofolate synthetase [Trichomonascus vanleenenianus]|uniref:dihydrofolate synthase n=1 Tax=Trichomonascus vanleenenianus TaxID=2268995 RepID=UPI003ECA16E5
MIDLGLARIHRLLKVLGDPHLAGWKAIHVAGTNGKGSVCAYLYSCLNEAGITSGRFTSPHLVHKWDCISINGKTVHKDLFYEVEDLVTKTNSSKEIGASEFEILTATAFEIFRRSRVSVAVIEVGLGGRLDATNALAAEKTLATVVTKVGLDHQNFLGNTLFEIATQKGGIIKPHVPCVVDATNDASVLDAIRQIAAQNSSRLIEASPDRLPLNIEPDTTPLLGAYQQSNMSCALNVIDILKSQYPALAANVEKGIRHTTWPGRLQWLPLTSSKKVLLDGAHNPQSAELLAQFVDSSVRSSGGVTYVLAFSKGKDYTDVISQLVRPEDSVVATSFGAVDGMPWVSAVDPAEIVETAKRYTTNVSIDAGDVKSLLDKVPDQTVICGSLYLVADVLRSIEDSRR